MTEHKPDYNPNEDILSLEDIFVNDKNIEFGDLIFDETQTGNDLRI